MAQNEMIVGVLILGIIIPGLGYLLMNSIQQGKQIAVLSSTVDQINTKMNLFLKTEIDTLKEIVTQNTEALKDLSK